MDNGTIQFAIGTRNDDCEDLEPLKIYQTLPDDSAAKEDYIRVIDESGEDYLYPESYFITINLPQVIEPTLLAVSNRLIKRNQRRGLL
ncbi:MAG: hypothetical protein DRR19_31230 [Candidatus Parabeggiatoa sp. nov. 1]|nr:MAG: hypothetical protein DRR19_31230 [Gammaproteobacteria bacterium]